MSILTQEPLKSSLAQYAEKLIEEGIHPSKLVLFGSFAHGKQTEWSDIDLVVVAPELEPPRTIDIADRLWYAIIDSDCRIEPVACGVREWEEGSNQFLVEIARDEGMVLDIESGEVSRDTSLQ